MSTTIEFWPEYGEGPLWTSDGEAVDLVGLGVSSELAEALRSWNAGYDDSKLPFEKNDRAGLEEGAGLLAAVRAELGDGFDVVVTEPWWGETPSAQLPIWVRDAATFRFVEAPDESVLLLRMTREWPWGIVMWSDPASNEPPPESFDEAGVAAARTVIVGPILHEVDGSATAEAWLGEPPATCLCIYDAALDLSTGRLAVSDAAMDDVNEAQLPVGTYRARLCVDDAEFPELSVLYLRRVV